MNLTRPMRRQRLAAHVADEAAAIAMRAAGPATAASVASASSASSASSAASATSASSLASLPSVTSAGRILVHVAVLWAACAGAALAGEHRRVPPDLPAAYAPECGSCHAPFAPGLLPRASWARVMAGLDRHYGAEASLEPALRRQIEAWLLANAGSGRKTGEAPPEDRITRAAWFERKHRRVEPATWQLPSVKTPVNCGACHTGADQGDYDDDRLRLPEGAGRTQRRAWRD